MTSELNQIANLERRIKDLEGAVSRMQVFLLSNVIMNDVIVEFTPDPELTKAIKGNKIN